MTAPETRTASVACVACLATVATATAIAVLAGGPTAFDQSLSAQVAAHRSSGVIWLMEGVTVAGSAIAIWLVAAACAVWATMRQDWRPLRFILPTALLASLATNAMKLAVARPRPPAPIALRHFSGYSFPSGHATTAAALWGALAVVVVRSGRVRARWAAAGWAVAVTAVGASRIVLGAHWLSDVVAGTAVGAGFVAGAVLLTTPHAGSGTPLDGEQPGRAGDEDAVPADAGPVA